MEFIFEIIDKTERKIHLSKERWSHIRQEHPEISEPEEIEKILINPEVILQSDRDENVRWYFCYVKPRKEYLKVSVKHQKFSLKFLWLKNFLLEKFLNI